MSALATIILTTHNRAHLLPDALNAAQMQTVDCEVIVVDDGSTDNTQTLLQNRIGPVSVVWQEHAGVAAARNRGLRLASAEFVMFLDDDDLVSPHKVARQIDAMMRAGTDWCICDTRIIDDISRCVELASDRYRYREIRDVRSELQKRNFIPVHAPLVRREAIEGIRFPEGKLEDWAFWREVATALGEPVWTVDVLCTYHKRRDGRNSAK